jgi:thiol-disulfide isomerase/thioredoxin
LNNKYKMDSALIENGRFSFKGTLTGPSQAMVTMDKSVSFFDKYVTLYIEPAQMQLSLDYDNFSKSAVLKGSALQAEADALNRSKAAIMNKLNPISEAYNKGNLLYIEAKKEKKEEAIVNSLRNRLDSLKEAMTPYHEQLNKIDKEFMDKHPASYVTASMMRMYISSMTLQEAEARYAKLPGNLQNSSLGNVLKKEIDGLRGGSPGSKAYVFTSTELRGDALSLTDYKGKYVLLDFWASWCVPCRKGNPHLLSLYSKYKEKGLEIIGVSDDDRNKEAWQKAVEKDQIGVWKHILRGLKQDAKGGFDHSTDISEPYGIHSLPTKILIDPNGIVVGRYGGGGEDDAALDKKFAEIFK